MSDAPTSSDTLRLMTDSSHAALRQDNEKHF